MKFLYDRKSQNRVFNPGDKVLVFLPIQGNTLQARYHGPYKVLKKVGTLDYVIETPDRRKSTQMCHVNMLKPYFERGKEKLVLATDSNTNSENLELCKTCNDELDVDIECKIRLTNSEILSDLDTKLSHVPPDKRVSLVELLLKYKSVFPNVPNKTNVLMHDVDVGNAGPVKQHPYRVNPIKLEKLRQEVQYMLDNNIIELSQSSGHLLVF